MKNLFLLLASLITIASVIPYVRDILKGTTKPNIVSWMTWTLLTGISTVAAISAGEYRIAIFTGTATLETAIIVVLGLRYGKNKYTKFDVVCQISALIGLLLWALFNNPAAAVIFSVAIDFIGALPTFRHAWLKPGEETWITYAMAGVGAVLALLALDTFNWVTLPYAIYIVLANLILCIFMLYGPHVRRR